MTNAKEGGNGLVNQYLVDIVERELSLRMDSSRVYSDGEFREIINECIGQLAKRTALKGELKKEIFTIVFNSHRKLGILQPLLDDPDVNEIMINGTDSIYIEKDGDMACCDIRYSDAGQLFNVIQSMVSWVNRAVNESSPIVDSRLADGSRVNVVLKPIALNGPVVTIRKFREKLFTMQNFIDNGTVSAKEASFLKKCVGARANIFVSGGTSSGKTTFLNVLAGFASSEERIITIEDSAELRLVQPNLVRLETKNSNSEGKGEISMRTLIKTSLRMRPDRIIVGEVRDESALDMLQAMCTGHDGSMSTAHANSAVDTIMRIETMALWEGHINSESVKRQIASGLDLIIHLRRGADMKRQVAEIAEVAGYSNGEVILVPLFAYGKEVANCKEGGRLCEKLKRYEDRLQKVS